MKRKFTLLLSMLLMLGAGSSWAETIEAASDGYYHITDKSTWSKFARTVNGTGGYTQNVGLNAVLDADITIENDGDFNAGFIVGNGSTPSGGVAAIYTGTFDGQGHTLTFTKTLNQEFLAPFGKVCGATIKNLKVAGTLTGEASNARIAVVAYVEHTAEKNTTVEYVSSALNITTTNKDFDGTIGGIVGLVNTGANLLVQGCMYTGTVTSIKSTSGILGYSRSNNVTIKNNLAKCTFILSNTSALSNRYIYRAADESSITNENNFYQITNTKSVPVSGYGTEANEAQYNSGEMAWYLSGADNSSSSTYFWGQDLNNASSTLMLTSDAAYKVFNAGDKYTNWTNTINNDEDWVTFSKLVANGYADMNVTMTEDVDAGSTMVGTSSKPYAGTFDGKGHTLKFTYDTGSGDRVAPFNYIKNATIKNLLTTGSISAGNVCAGIVGDALGENTITCCGSNITLESTSRVGGLVGRCADSGASVAFSYCFFNGSLSSKNANEANGLVGYNTKTVTTNYCLIAPTSVENGNKTICGSTDPTQTNTYYYYARGVSFTTNQGTEATTAQLNSGSLAYALNSGNTGILFFGQSNLNKSIASTVPELTSDESKKVIKITCTNGPLYANKGGAMPSPVGVKALSLRTWNGSAWLNGPFDEDVSLQRVYNKYILNVSSAGATTLVLPGNVSSLPEGVKAYKLTYTSGDEVTAKEVTSITANEPVLINAPEGQYVLTTDNDDSKEITYNTETAYSNGALYGVYTDTYKYVPANSYVLQNGADAEGLGFYKVKAENTIKITSFRAYLTAQAEPAEPGSSSAPRLSIVYNNNTTGINSVREQTNNDDAIYTLNGVRVSRPTKGIYIKNGRKYIVK